MARFAPSSLDARIGDAVEWSVRVKHRRRLRRLGWSRALEPDGTGPFAAGDPPPRPGNRVDVLIDGAQVLPAIAEAVAGARHRIHITGWHVAPSFELVRGEPSVGVGPLLAEVAERVEVRMLVWAGAPVPAFHPTRKEVEAAVHELVRDTRIRCERDPREHPFHCHHEKTVVVDGELAFVGGVDLTDQAGDRFDDDSHPARGRLGWHDAAVRLRGPVVTDVDAHFRTRWLEVTGERLATPDPPGPCGSSTVQIVRTVAEDMYKALPTGDFRILETYVRALRSAETLVYLENQFLWAPELVAILADKLRRPPRPDFRVVIVLPARAANGQEDTRGQLAVLADADGGNDRLLAATIRSRSGRRTGQVYVHAKVALVDDRRLTIGSANLNAHSLLNDTEMNVACDDADLARETRVRLWAEHLEMSEEEVRESSPSRLVDERWIPIAREQLARERQGWQATHRLVELPGVSRRSARLLGPLQGLLDDG